MDSKELLKQTLDFYKYKLENNLCTMEDLQSIADLIKKDLDIVGTVEDFAKFCNTSESNIRTIISRHIVEKPKRRVYYKFQSFIQSVSDKLLKSRKK